MVVTVRGLPELGRVEVTGNLEATLEMPSAWPCRFYLAFSDGTLIEGRHEDRIYIGSGCTPREPVSQPFAATVTTTYSSSAGRSSG
jgi:hypothetical protein